jgi:Ni/Co efflux regulator RcnB
MHILLIGAALALVVAHLPTAQAGGRLRGEAESQPQSQLLLLAGGKGKGNSVGHGNGNGGGVFLPPGQAKKWARGQYLPKSLVWTPAPAALIAKLKPVPPGHRYVVVDGEVLLIALATGLILDVFDVI